MIKEKILALYKKFQQTVNVTVFFSLVYLFGWIMNGIGKANFNLGDLIIFYTTIIAKGAVTHGINSIFNSPKGEMPMGNAESSRKM